MNVYSTIPRYKSLVSIPVLSKKARQRLKWFDYYDSHGHNARLTRRYLSISPQIFDRLKKSGVTLIIRRAEDRSHHPKHLRQPTYSVELVEAVLGLREEYPR